ncbi:MAG: sensor histidine kinase [Bacteroidota bacterium]
MNKLLLIFSLSFFYTTNAQETELKQLEKKIAAAREDTVKYHLLIDAAELLTYTDSAKAFAFANRAFTLAEKLGDYTLAATAINTKAIVYDSYEDYERAIQLYYTELDYMQRHKALKKLGPVYNNLGNTYLSFEKNDSALFYFKKALERNLKTNAVKPTAIAYGSLGNYFQTVGDYQTAAENYLLALRYKEQLGDETSIANTKTNLIVLFKEMEQYDDALRYGKQALAVYEKKNEAYDVTIVNVNLALVFARLKKYDSAIVYYKRALVASKTISFLEGTQAAYSNMAIAYRLNGNNVEAIQALDSAWSTTKKAASNTARFSIAAGYVSTYVNLNQTQNAKPWIDTASKYLAFVNEKLHRKEYFQMLAGYYFANGQYQQAYLQQKNYEAVKDSLLNEGSVKTVQLLKTRFETEKKEALIKEQKFIIDKRNYTIIAIASLITVAAIISWLLFNRFRLQKKNELQQQLNRQQQKSTIDILTAEEKERKRIASDLHDGVGQLMTAAWLNLQALVQQNKTTDEGATQLLTTSMHLVDESCKEVRAVSHNMMPNALLKKGLVNAVREFIQQINVKQTKINLQTDGMNNPLAPHVETVLYRVIQESVNNVVKHAQASSLDISIEQDETGIDVLIEDNGRGFDFETAVKQDGIGLQNIMSRVQYLNGTVQWNSAPQKGTLVAIHIPIEK